MSICEKLQVMYYAIEVTDTAVAIWKHSCLCNLREKWASFWEKWLETPYFLCCRTFVTSWYLCCWEGWLTGIDGIYSLATVSQKATILFRKYDVAGWKLTFQWQCSAGTASVMKAYWLLLQWPPVISDYPLGVRKMSVIEGQCNVHSSIWKAMKTRNGGNAKKNIQTISMKKKTRGWYHYHSILRRW
jgi:hypothetical protein